MKTDPAFCPNTSKGEQCLREPGHGPTQHEGISHSWPMHLPMAETQSQRMEGMPETTPETTAPTPPEDSHMNQPLAREQVQTEERLQAIAKVFDEHEAYAGGFGCSCQPEDTHPNAFPGAKVMLDEVWERHIARAILVRLDRLGLIR